MKLYNSWRDSADVPSSWRPRAQPGTLLKVPVKNKAALRELRRMAPGQWFKVYHYGADGSAVHYFQHVSGKVAAVKYKPSRLE